MSQNLTADHNEYYTFISHQHLLLQYIQVSARSKRTLFFSWLSAAHPPLKKCVDFQKVRLVLMQSRFAVKRIVRPPVKYVKFWIALRARTSLYSPRIRS